MANDEVTIYNWALAAVGTVARVQSPDEASDEAEACSLWYETVRDQILQTAPWDSAKAFKRLAQSSEQTDETWIATDPAPGWRFAYAFPSDMLRPRYITNYARFELGTNSANQRVIYTNQEAAILCYTKRQVQVSLWDEDLKAAVAFALAAHICMKLTGSLDRVQFVTAQAYDKVLAARQQSANTPQANLVSTPSWIAARGYAGTAPESQYVYPNAEFTVAGFNYAVV